MTSIGLQERDPYFVVKGIIQKQATKLSENFERWKDLLETTNTAKSPEFSKLSNSVRANIRKLTKQLNDVQKTVEAVERNREKYSHISDQELGSRQKFINDMRAIVQGCDETLNSDRTKEKTERDRKQIRTTPKPMSGLERERERDNEQFLSSHHDQQELQVRQQDVVLDDMTSSLQRLGFMGKAIQVELEEQSDLLTELNEDIDGTQAHMNVVQKKLDKLIDTKDTKKIVLIVVLIIVFVILLYFTFT